MDRHGTSHFGMDSISIEVEEVDAGEWKEKVCLTEVQAKANKLHKKPGYSM